MAKKEKEANKKQKGHFFKDMKAELKKVIWPSPKQLANNTLAVIGFTLIVAVIVFILDVAFDAINKKGVVALQEKVKTSLSANNTTSENTSSEGNETSNGNTSNTESENSSDNNNTTNESKENTTSEDNKNATNVKVETNTESKK